MSYEGKKNPPKVYETEDGTERGQVEGLSSQLSEDDNTIPVESRQEKIPLKIEDYLQRGHDNAIPKEGLQRITGLGKRQVTQAVQDARRRGVPILSSSHPGGYYIAATVDEKKCFEKSLRHRAAETAYTLKCLERATVEELENGKERPA